jgi:surface antigen
VTAQETYINSQIRASKLGSNKSKVYRANRSTKRRIFSRFTRSNKRTTRFSIVAANLALLIGVGLLVIGGDSSSSTSRVDRASALGTQESEATNPLDELSSVDIAVNVSRATNMEEATSVTNKADTASAQVAVASADDKIISKPQLMAEGLKSKKDIKLYTADKDDTVASVAAQFDVTSDTIRLSNGLEGDDLSPGQKLWISPVNGIVYEVKSGDTPASVASKYRADKDQLVAFNDAEIGGLRVGERIVIPDGLSPISSQYNYYSSNNPRGFAFGNKAQYGQNGYDYGWCTWHAANRRNEIGRPIPSNMGNAISWLGVARAAGLGSGSLPQEGAVVYHLDIGGWGHVAFVEKVNPDGSAKVSDMNYPTWGQVTYRTIKPSEFDNYRFIY